ncbi:MAG: hypothetical protein ABI402_00075 [Ferruginibacter sp.]
MKNAFFCFLFLIIITNVSAQLKATPQCPEMIVNIQEGSVNKIQPNISSALIEKTFPCYTSMEPEGDSSKCGGLISFSDKDIYFYTGRDYIEIGEKFKGKLSIPLLGAVRADLFKWLGYPKIKDITWDAFQTAYGVLIVYYDKSGKINKIQMSTKSTDSIKLCQ